MKTIYSIIENENKIFEEHINNELNASILYIEDEKKLLRKKIVDNKKIRSENENKIREIKENYDHKINCRKKYYITVASYIILWVGIIMFLCSKFEISFWYLVLYAIVSIIILGICHNGINLILLGLNVFDDGEENFSESTLTEIQNNMKNLTTSLQEIQQSINTFEVQLKKLESNIPKVEDFYKLYNTKDFFEEIHNKIQKEKKYLINLLSVGHNKMSIIQLLKELSGIGLKESKDLIDNTPCIIIDTQELYLADAIKTEFILLGATVEIIES